MSGEGSAVRVARLFGVDVADLAGLRLSVPASFTLMGGYYLIQPLSEEMSLRAGIRMTPLFTVARLPDRCLQKLPLR